MFCRTSYGVRVWEDFATYRDTDELIGKCRDVLYGEGSRGKKDIPDTVLVARDINNRYNMVSFGREVHNKEAENYRSLVADTENMLYGVGGFCCKMIDLYVYGDIGSTYVRVRWLVSGRVHSAVSGIVDGGSGIVLSDLEVFIRSICLGSSLDGRESYIPYVEKFCQSLSVCYAGISAYGVPVDSFCLYRLNQDNGKCYVGFGLADYMNYNDLSRRAPGEYRMSVFCEG